MNECTCRYSSCDDDLFILLCEVGCIDRGEKERVEQLLLHDRGGGFRIKGMPEEDARVRYCTYRYECSGVRGRSQPDEEGDSL